MDVWSDRINEAIACCVSRKWSFCAYLLPHATGEPVFFANGPDSSLASKSGKPRFFIGRWGDDSEKFQFIEAEMTAPQVLVAAGKGVEADLKIEIDDCSSTSHQQYAETIQRLRIHITEEKLGKVVLSCREYVENHLDIRAVLSLAAEVFAAYPDCFRHLWFTPDLGLWIGASPEELLSVDYSSGTFTTMSLAGTRKAQSGRLEDWSAKDCREQQFVTDYISEVLTSSGYSFTMQPTETFRVGDIEHRCTRFNGYMRGSAKTDEALTLLNSLNPTPAVCGYPRERAATLINSLEPFSRNCYGGVVGVETSACLHAYVNLRCCRIGSNGLLLYAGGGILSDSDTDEEWLETRRKMNAIGHHVEKNAQLIDHGGER